MTENVSFSRQITMQYQRRVFNFNVVNNTFRPSSRTSEYRRMFKNYEKVIVMEIVRHMFCTIFDTLM